MAAEAHTKSGHATTTGRIPGVLEEMVPDDVVMEALARTNAAGQDASGMNERERELYVLDMCRVLKLSPLNNPVQFLKMQGGKYVLYIKREATDQLAARYNLNREIVDGPKVIDLAGTKVVYALCKATLPNGRYETSTATLPLTDPVNVLMKCETKAKRRATLSILGLGLMDESEIDGIPGAVRVPSNNVGTRATEPPPAMGPAEDPERAAIQSETPVALGSFLADLEGAPTPTDAVVLFRARRDALTIASDESLKAAKKALSAHVAKLLMCDPKAAGAHVAKLLAKLDGPPDDPTRGGAHPVHDPAETGDPADAVREGARATGSQASADWRTTPEGRLAHLRTIESPPHILNSVQCHARILGVVYGQEAARVLRGRWAWTYEEAVRAVEERLVKAGVVAEAA